MYFDENIFFAVVIVRNTINTGIEYPSGAILNKNINSNKLQNSLSSVYVSGLSLHPHPSRDIGRQIFNSKVGFPTFLLLTFGQFQLCEKAFWYFDEDCISTIYF